MLKLFKPSKNEAQKSKVIATGIAISIALVAFQNCGKVNKVGPESVNHAAEQKPAIHELNSSDSLVLLANGEEGFGLFAYDVNVASGEVTRTMYEVPKEDPANKPVKLCLSEEKRLKLEQEMNESSVCFFSNKGGSDRACIQIYRYPYAIIQESRAGIRDVVGNTYKLGENSSACADFYDICTDNREDFIGAVAEAVAGLDSSTCD